MTVAGAAVDAVYANGTVTYTPLEDLAEGRTSVTVTVTRADGKAAAKTWSFTVGVAAQQLYFGQLHPTPLIPTAPAAWIQRWSILQTCRRAPTSILWPLRTTQLL